jgi:hypothetical protein
VRESIVLATLIAALGAAPARGSGLPLIEHDTAEAYLPDFARTVWVTDASSATIPLVISAPLPGPATVVWNAWGDVTMNNGNLFLPAGATASGYQVTFGTAPGTPFYESWVYWPVDTYLVALSGVTVGPRFIMSLIRVAETGSAAAGAGGPAGAGLPSVAGGGPASGTCCLMEFLCLLTGSITWCSQVFHSADVLGTLTRYRDEVLAVTPDGQYYMNLYTTHSPDLIRASVKQPDLVGRIILAMEPWSDALLALVNGQGSGVTVTAAMRDSMLDVLDRLQQSGSPALASAIAFERQRLSLDTIAGLTMDQFQQQVETLGGPTSVEARSWGQIKALYR